MGEEALRFGITAPNAERFGNPRQASEVGRMAEEAGWDGYFIWDSLFFYADAPRPVFDPWVTLTAVAMATERIRIGTCVAVLPRYKPQALAMTLASLDVLSEGRVTLGVGIGFFADEFEVFGEVGDNRIRAEKLDESLEVITRLWSGNEVNYQGDHFEVHGVVLEPLLVQAPRIPVWVGGDSAPALRRAGRWDGWIGPTEPWKDTWTPQDLASFRERIENDRDSSQPLEIAWNGTSTPEDGDLVDAYRQAGATWWIELIDWSRGSYDEAIARVAAGPPH